VSAGVAVMWLWSLIFGVTTSRSYWGTCPALSSRCTDVPVSGLEKFTGLRFPAGTVVKSSSSTGGFMNGGGTVWATLQLPDQAPSPFAGQSPTSTWRGTTTYDTRVRGYVRNITEKRSKNGHTLINIEVDVIS
jgi:hypothetical protein